MRGKITALTGPNQNEAYLVDSAIGLAFGRASGCGVRLRDTNVSRVHCKVWEADGRFHVQDLGSSNSTLVNGEPVTECVIEHGDRLEVGSSAFLFEVEDATPTFEAEIVADEQVYGRVRATVPRSNARYAQPRISVRSRARLERIATDLKSLYDLANVLHTSHNVDVILHELLGLVFRVIGAERGAVLLRDDRSGELKPHVVRNALADDEQPVGVSKTITERCLRENVAILVDDALTDPRFMNAESVHSAEMRSVLCVPIDADGDAVGLIHLDTRMSSGAFDEDDLQLMSAIAVQAGIAIQNIQFKRNLERQNLGLRRALMSKHEIIGSSPAVKQVLELISKVAATDSTVLIRGGSGTGKELVAHAIHYSSDRKDRPLVCVDCGAVPDTLLAGELFGHEKGAFTGATHRKIGKFEQANHGTVFLDEVGSMEVSSQAKLLRILDQKQLQRLGGTETIEVDVRLIAATNEDLEQAVREGRLREDLYFRLKVVQLEIPPLRARREDIPELAEHFLEQCVHKAGRYIGGIDPDAMELLKNHDWPGNVRELRNCIEQAVLLGNSDHLVAEDFANSISVGQTELHPDQPELLPLKDIEREHIIYTLGRTNWNKTRAAELLGIERSTLYQKLKQYGITRSS